ncbi:MAG TPA: chemotaxis protein CheA, partial [Candidatus Acidoferrum sp.]|nr:chemotaxis protein CheA [Candidatus Acidoferrum sp.]
EIIPLDTGTALTPDAMTAEPPLLLALENDSDLLREFCNESQEHLQNVELGVLTLEENPGDMSTLNSIFRAFHTFKGGSGFLNLKAINSLAHELESLLDLARQQKLTITSEVIEIILSGGDTLKQFIIAIVRQLDGHEAGAPIVVPTLALRTRVRAVLSGASAPAKVEKPVSASATGTAPAMPIILPPAKSGSAKAPAESGSTSAPASVASSVKVNTSKLDSLVDLVGELVIAQSQVSQDPALQTVESRLLARNLAQVGRITRELQRTAMSLRMVPIRQTFQKMTRLVRDSSARLGKQIELTMSGEDTELDRIIVEEISDPLIHMVRNSVDHGIEKPEVRQQRGKPACGTVHLAACHQGGNIIIEIKDDGGGLNTERILAKAIAQGIVQPNAILSDEEIFSLIFAPGFSTAETITDISGRGVGMDVVRKNIDKLRGKIDIASTLGEGSRFTISLPLTLAIIDGLIVGVGGERFILPTLSVRESFRPKREMISTIHERGEMVNVRGHLSPLLRLSEYFNIPAQATDPTEGIVIVIEAGGSDRCLLVDQLIGKQEVVIKSLGETFKNNRALAGAAILGDGRVGLILEVNSLVRLSREPLARAA